MTETGVIDKVALVYGQMNEPPGARLRVGLGADDGGVLPRRGQDVLLFIDNIFRFVQAGSEVSALLGRMPSAVGYQPTLATEMGQLQERITSTERARSRRCRRSTCPPTTCRPGAREHVRAPRRHHRPLALDLGEGHLPGDRPARLDLAPSTAGRRRRALRHGDARPGDPPALQGPPGHHRDPRHGRALRRGQARRAARARSSVSSRSRSSSPRPSRGSRASTYRSRRRSRASSEIIEGKHDDLNEQAFYMVGTIDEATMKARGEDPVEARRKRREAAGAPRLMSARPRFDVSLVTPDGPVFEATSRC